MLMSYVLNEELETMYDQRITNYEEFKMTYNVAMTNKKGKYDTLTLFSNGLNVCLRANMINHYLGRSRNKAKAIKKDYEKLVIKRTCDLAYKGDEILRITGINDTDMINDIMDEVILKILNKEIKNNHDDIEKEVIRILTDRGIYFDLNRELVLNRTSEELEIKENDDFSELEKELEEMKDNEAEKELSTEERLSVLEEKVDEQHKIILEKSEKIAELEKQKIIEVSSKLVNNNIDLIKRDGQINSMIDDLNQFELDLRAFLVDYLQKGKEDEED